jgi:hypothetical protein
MTVMKHAIWAEGLVRRFGETTALDGVRASGRDRDRDVAITQRWHAVQRWRGVTKMRRAWSRADLSEDPGPDDGVEEI